MHQNTIYICISWYSKSCWFPVRKCWYQQNSRGVSRDSYIFWIFLGLCITVPRFITVGYVWQILGRGAIFPLLPPHPWAALKKPILNRVKIVVVIVSINKCSTCGKNFKTKLTQVDSKTPNYYMKYHSSFW